MTGPADSLPYLTPDLPGIGGTIRSRPEDFFVQEVPLYEPSGRGEHLYLLIEKQGLSTFEATFRLAKALGKKTSDFGLAGLKDSDAVTRQYISIQGIPLPTLKDLSLPGIRILDVVPHKNKLKMGHLRGNRFRIVIEGPLASNAAQRAAEVIEVLEERGVPNYFGPQRFGLFDNTHLLGRAMVLRDWKAFLDILVATPRESVNNGYDEVIEAYHAEDYRTALEKLGRDYKYERKALAALAHRPQRLDRAVGSIDKRMLRFYLSAYQSALFNRYLSRRLSQINRLVEGEIAFIHRNGAAFLVEDEAREAPRVEAREISPSGPLFGEKMLRPEGTCRELEDEILKEEALSPDQIKGVFGIRVRGARRALRIPLEDCEINEVERGLELTFFLPLGSYATVLLREVMKTEKNENSK